MSSMVCNSAMEIVFSLGCGFHILKYTHVGWRGGEEHVVDTYNSWGEAVVVGVIVGLKQWW